MSNGQPTSTENAPPVTIDIAGVELRGWSGLQIQRSIDAAADQFSFSVPWDPNPENRERFRPYNQTSNGIARVFVGDQLLLRGYIESVKVTSAGEQRAMTLSGRSETGVLVDWSVGPKYQWADVTFNTIASEAATPYSVIANPDTRPLTAEAEIGQTVFEFLSSIAAANGLWAVPDTAQNARGGGSVIRFVQLSASRRPIASLIGGTSPLVEISTNHDVTKRFREYTVVQETAGATGTVTVEDRAMALSIRGRKVIEVQQESNDLTFAASFARSRALIESYNCNATVTGWTYGGTLWAPGEIVLVSTPDAMIYGTKPLMISQVTFQMDQTGGQQCQLSLSLPEAYSGGYPAVVPWMD